MRALSGLFAGVLVSLVVATSTDEQPAKTIKYYFDSEGSNCQILSVPENKNSMKEIDDACSYLLRNYSVSKFNNNKLVCVGLYEAVYRVCNATQPFKSLTSNPPQISVQEFCNKMSLTYTKLELRHLDKEVVPWVNNFIQKIVRNDTCFELCLNQNKVLPLCDVILDANIQYFAPTPVPRLPDTTKAEAPLPGVNYHNSLKHEIEESSSVIQQKSEEHQPQPVIKPSNSTGKNNTTSPKIKSYTLKSTPIPQGEQVGDDVHAVQGDQTLKSVENKTQLTVALPTKSKVELTQLKLTVKNDIVSDRRDESHPNQDQPSESSFPENKVDKTHTPEISLNVEPAKLEELPFKNDPQRDEQSKDDTLPPVDQPVDVLDENPDLTMDKDEEQGEDEDDVTNSNVHMNLGEKTSVMTGDYVVRDKFAESEDSNFVTYFVIMSGLVIIVYLAFHNKKKIVALAIEGRRGRGGRSRGRHSASYSKLHSNLEEAIASNSTPQSAPNLLY